MTKNDLINNIKDRKSKRKIVELNNGDIEITYPKNTDIAKYESDINVFDITFDKKKLMNSVDNNEELKTKEIIKDIKVNINKSNEAINNARKQLIISCSDLSIDDTDYLNKDELEQLSEAILNFE